MFVKICGITREADARAAVECGASAIGFIFWPKSKRYIEPGRARQIARTLPPFVTPVGVFVNEPAGHVNSVAAAAGLGAGRRDLLRRVLLRAVGRQGRA